jgi:hypothetical protein
MLCCFFNLFFVYAIPGLLLNNYPFKVYYDETSQKISQDVGINKVVALKVISSLKSASISDPEPLIIDEVFKVYPNPFDDVIYISFGLTEQTESD